MDSLTSIDFWQLLFLLAILIAVFFVFRELVLWYYKINERVELLKQNNALLSEIRDLLKPAEKLSATDVNNPKTMDELEQKLKNK